MTYMYFQLDHTCIQKNLVSREREKTDLPKMCTCIGLLIEIKGTELKNTSWYKIPQQPPKNMTDKGLIAILIHDARSL